MGMKFGIELSEEKIMIKVLVFNRHQMVDTSSLAHMDQLLLMYY